jgi:ATP-dependent RNA helicase DDX3X
LALPLFIHSHYVSGWCLLASSVEPQLAVIILSRSTSTFDTFFFIESYRNTPFLGFILVSPLIYTRPSENTRSWNILLIARSDYKLSASKSAAMSDWDSAAKDLALALPEASSTGAPPVAASPASGQEVQNTGAWGEKVAYDYDRFNLTTKEATDRDVANGIESGDWASNAPIYEFNDEYGDVGPEFADLEEQLFGGVQQQKGINYSK